MRSDASSGQRASAELGDHAPLATPAFELSELRLHAPLARSGIVDRADLVNRLVATPAPPIVSIVGPPGYGKTTVLAQWARRKHPRAAWISLDERDNDPFVLLTYLVAAVDRIEPLDPLVFESLTARDAAIIVPRQLVAAIAAMSQPVAVVLDHLEAITNRQCLDVVAELALGLPDGSQLAMAARGNLPPPLERLRNRSGILEVGIEDLAMGQDEAAALLREAGVEVAPGDLGTLVAQTEGWPAGLYLTALAMNARRSGTPIVVAGDDRFIRDYLSVELLDQLSSDEVVFLTRTSILDSLCGPLCEAVIGSSSAVQLAQLERRNLLVVPLDGRCEWYRYHHLFRELLRSELQQREPDVIPELHRRAASWCESNGLPETAIDHAQRADDPDRVARLVLQMANPTWAGGRADTVLRWMDWFEANDLVERYPGIAVHGALMYALVGRPGGTERWAVAAEATFATGTLPDGNTMEASLAYLRALLCRDGVTEMRRDAQIALKGLSPASPYRATMLHAEGVSYLLEGDLDAADETLAHAQDSATHFGVLPFVPVVIAERGIVAIERGDWPAVDTLLGQALSMMQHGDFDDYWTSALVYAWAARAGVRRGDDTRDLAARAARLRPLLTYALPVVSVQALLEMARAYIALDDAGGAAAVLRQVHDVLQQRPDLGTLPGQTAELQAQLVTIGSGGLGTSSLTTAELRLLPLLSTHLSFREIGERLYVSRHTVKSQAISIYRKLGVSSRSETITRVDELGLVGRGDVGR